MIPHKTVAFYTLGCKLNFSETSTIARNFEQGGFAKVEFETGADIYVINTCSVTDLADKKCRNIIRKAKKYNPFCFVVVIGCYAQLKPKEIADIKGVNLVLGANEKFNILQYLDDYDQKNKFITGHIKDVKTFVPSFSQGDRTRTFLKVQDGCDYFCSFCTIPLARGRSRNATISETVKTAQQAINLGAKEIVLTGVNIGDFGKSSQETFLDLIKQLDVIPGEVRYRISSIEPNLLSDEIISFVLTSQKFSPHFHIPLQSGSNKVLTLMRRRYQTPLYAERVKLIKKLNPNACIGVDVIVGYPGETDELFLETYEFLKNLDVSYFHVFTYSERPNTVAIRSQDIVPIEVRNKRSQMLRILSNKKKRAFYENQKALNTTVLFEEENDEGYMYGFTENYIKVRVGYNADLVNQFVSVTLNKIGIDGNFEVTLLQPQMAN